MASQFPRDGLFRLNTSQFDFSVPFEQVFFSVLPAALFVVAAIWRTWHLSLKPVVVDAPTFQQVKVGLVAAYVGAELCQMILAAVAGSSPSGWTSQTVVSASVVRLLAAGCMVLVSAMDHSRSLRPSLLMTSYLLVTLLLDGAQTRTFFLTSESDFESDSDPEKSRVSYSSIFAAGMVLKTVLLLLEAQQKTKWAVDFNEKQHSPEETSGIFSLGVFFWLNRIFFVGYRKVMGVDDLYPLDQALEARRLHASFAHRLADDSKWKGAKFGLSKMLCRTLKTPLLLAMLPRLAMVGFALCQPLFIEKLLEYLQKLAIEKLTPSPPIENKNNIGYGLIGASFLIYVGIGVSQALFFYLHHRARVMVTSILVTATYTKATRSQLGAAGDSSHAALTLMSTDMERINLGFRLLHSMWASPLQAAIASWMLYQRLGIVFLVPLGLVIVCFGAIGVFVRITGDSQRSWMAGVQKRVGLTANVISGMKSLKISGLSGVVARYVQQLRVDELAAGSRFRKIFIVAALLAYIPMIIGPPLTLAFTQRVLDAKRMFTSLSFLTLMASPLCDLFQSVPEIISAFACLGRIQEYLESPAHHDYRLISSSATEASSDAAIVIEKGQFAWEEDKPILRNIDTRIAKSALTMVVGPIGCGKSSFSKALLGEIPFHQGGRIVVDSSLYHHGRIGFCDQTASLFNGTVRENIVGFAAFDPSRYAAILDATALHVDLAILPRGDKTNIGSDGVALSGGQKQRVSLARSLYLETDLLILDDIFAGLDANTEQHVFHHVFAAETGLLRKRQSTVVLCTHSIQHLPEADYIIALGDGGVVAEQGTFPQLMENASGYVRRLLDAIQHPSSSDGENQTSGQSSSSKTENRTFVNVVEAAEAASDFETDQPATSSDLMARQVGDKSVFVHYFKSMGLSVALSALIAAILWGFFSNYPTVWLTYWTDDSARATPRHSYRYYASVYAALQLCAMLSLLVLAISIYIVSVNRAGRNLHQQILHTLVHAPLHFFAKTETGEVTNLFSQDLNLIDTELPNATLNVLYSIFCALGQAGVILTSSLYLAISYPFLVALLYLVQKFYLRTSRQLRLLGLETKSPLYTHFLDTLNGLATLRASGYLQQHEDRNIIALNTTQRPSYLLLMIQSWLTLVLDMVVVVMAVVLTALSVRLESSSGFAGAALFSLMSFGETLSSIVVFYTKLETSIGGIARLKSFNETVKPEDRDDETIVPPPEWPEHGRVEMHGVCASYAEAARDDPFTEDPENLTLDNIDLIIEPAEKIAICGRTGSGKSSLVALLLKLLNPLRDTPDDAILIDGLALSRIQRSSLRQECGVIAVPQDAVFLPDGTPFKEQLDPSGIATPQDCQDVLEAVGLWDFVQQREGGLDAGMNGASLSAGQRQLLSLGRAVLRRRLRPTESGILILDEVSSSVDRETESLMQTILRTEFSHYTVIAISHRLDMIMDFDRVVVMDTGRIVEVGNPRVLAEKADTLFGGLLRSREK